MSKTCLHCTEPLSRYQLKFCSSSCAAIVNNRKRKPRSSESRIKTSKSLRKFNKDNPSVVKARAEAARGRPWKKITYVKYVSCKNCSKGFWAELTYITKRQKRLTCSTKCHREIVIKNGIRTNISTVFCPEINNQVTVHSTWEHDVAIYLNENKIRWIRPDFIEWIDSAETSHKYYPDFYLIDYELYLDPKNPYRMKIDEEKLSYVSKKINLQAGSVESILALLGGLEPNQALASQASVLSN